MKLEVLSVPHLIGKKSCEILSEAAGEVEDVRRILMSFQVGIGECTSDKEHQSRDRSESHRDGTATKEPRNGMRSTVQWPNSITLTRILTKCPKGGLRSEVLTRGSHAGIFILAKTLMVYF